MANQSDKPGIDAQVTVVTGTIYHLAYGQRHERKTLVFKGGLLVEVRDERPTDVPSGGALGAH